MRPRTRIPLGLALTALIAAAVIHRTRPENEAAAGHAASGPGKQHVLRFWKLNHDANRLRLEGKSEAAIDLYRECLSIRPTHEDSLYYLGLSLEEIGEYGKAAALYRRMGELNPSSSRAFAQLGQVLSTPAPGAPLDFKEAERAFRRCVDLNREHSGPYLNLGTLKVNVGRLDEALEHFRTAARFGSPRANLLAGHTCLLLGRKKESGEFLQKVVDWYAHERKIARQGAVLEGDLFSDAQDTVTPQQALAMQAAAYRFWLDPASLPEFAATLEDRARERMIWKEAGAVHGLTRAAGRAAWSDFDGDGRVDVVAGAGDGALRLYRNTGKSLLDITQTSGLSGVDRFWDAVWGDYDLDGDPDLYVVRSGFAAQGENRLYRNNGGGTFSDMTEQTGLAGTTSTFRALFVDLDQDGRPELVEWGASSGGFAPLRVFRYDGKRWSNQTAAWRLDIAGTVVDCAAEDYDLDGAADLFVYRWGRAALLLRNTGGKFEDVTEDAGLGSIHGAGFSAIFFDYDRNRFPDLLVTTHAAFPDVLRGWFAQMDRSNRPSLRLFRNRGGQFEEVSQAVGLTHSFGTIEARSADLDGNGWPDLILANGGLDALRVEPSVILRNLKGTAFEISALLPGLGSPSNAIGVDTPDLDGDGRPEIYLTVHPVVRSAFSSSGLFVSR